MNAKLEVMPALSAKVAKRIEAVKTFHAGAIGGFEDHIAYSFLCGRELLDLKNDPDVKHGDYEKLCAAELPNISKTARHYYRGFTQSLIAKSSTVEHLAREPLLLSDGKVQEKDRRAICKAAHDVCEGKTFTEMCRSLGLIRKAKTHSEVDHSRKGPAMSAAEKRAAQRLEDLDWIGLYCGKGATLLRDDEMVTRLTREDRERMINMNVRVNNRLRGEVDKAEKKKIEATLAVEDAANGAEVSREDAKNAKGERK